MLLGESLSYLMAARPEALSYMFVHNDNLRRRIMVHNNSFKQKNCMTGFQHEIVPWGQIGVEVVLHSKVIVHNI